MADTSEFPQSIIVIGITDAGHASLPPSVMEHLLQAETVAGGERHLSFFPDLTAQRITIAGDTTAAMREIATAADQGKRVVVLASGDPLIFGIGAALLRQFPRERLCFLPAPSSVQLAFAAVAEPWHDAAILSAHGRPLPSIIPSALKASKMAILTDQRSTPAAIAEALLESGMEDCRAVVCERLGSPSQRVVETRLVGLPDQRFDPLNVLLLFRDPRAIAFRFGQPEEGFVSARGQITKAEVRAVTLSKLRLRPNGVLWDIGAGSGALAVEAAGLMPGGRVFAVERDSEQQHLIRENCRRRGATNVELAAGEAPEALAALPAPDSVFLGGSGGRLEELLQVLPRPFVANLAVMEHLGLLLRAYPEAEVVQLSVSRNSDIGRGHRLAALNPVFIVSVPAP